MEVMFLLIFEGCLLTIDRLLNDDLGIKRILGSVKAYIGVLDAVFCNFIYIKVRFCDS